MPEVTHVDLLKTGGKLIPPGALPQVGPKPAPKASQNPTTGPTPTPVSDSKSQSTDPTPPDTKGDQCPHCGWFQHLSPVEPTIDQLAWFRESVWNGKPFTAEWNLFDDAVTVRFRGLSAVEENAVRMVVTKEMLDGKFGNSAMSHFAVIERQTDLRFGLAVEFLRVGDKVHQPAPPPDPYTADLGARFAALMASFPIDAAYRGVRTQYGQFQGILHTIEARALNVSFSPATPSSGA